MSLEDEVIQQIRLAASKSGARLWRNNNGAAYDERGHLVRYGLANESAELSKKIKSSDLIGIEPVLILPEHVGTIIGRLVSIEAKREGWTYKGTDREKAQLAWINLINELGGRAGFATGPGEAGY